MAELVKSKQWRVIAETVIGASHIASGLPNQDGLRIAKPRGGSGLIASVADGHGSAKYVRSHIGAKIATEVAIAQLGEFLSLPLKRILGFHPAELEEILARQIVRSWTKRVEEHAQTQPFTGEERNAAGADVVSAYGSTLLVAAATNDIVAVAQIGDGDVLFVSGRGQVTRPLARDSRMLGNETISLCSPDAVQSMRVRLKSLSSDDSERPEVILLATDGYANCFKDEPAFAKAACDYAHMLKVPKGLRSIQENIGGWLRDASDRFSGDDITVAVMYSKAAMQQQKDKSAVLGT